MIIRIIIIFDISPWKNLGPWWGEVCLRLLLFRFNIFHVGFHHRWSKLPRFQAWRQRCTLCRSLKSHVLSTTLVKKALMLLHSSKIHNAMLYSCWLSPFLWYLKTSRLICSLLDVLVPYLLYLWFIIPTVWIQSGSLFTRIARLTTYSLLLSVLLPFFDISD